jgi:hypothetical protein
MLSVVAPVIPITSGYYLDQLKIFALMKNSITSLISATSLQALALHPLSFN